MLFRSRMTLRFITAIVLVVCVSVVATAGWVVLSGVREDTEKTDAIVVMGAAQFNGDPSPVLRNRLDRALSLYKAKVSSHLITVGGKRAGDRMTEATAGRDYLRKFTEDSAPERDTMTASGRLDSLEDIIGAVQGINRKSAEELAAEKRVKERLEEKASDEGYEKQRKADMWQTLAEIGFNMASSKSPYVLQAIGEAASASMPGARADKKDRKEAKDRALEGLMELGARNRKEAMDALQVAIPVWQAGMQAEQFEKKAALEGEQLGLEREKLGILRAQAEAKQTTPEALVMSMYFSGDPKLKAQAEGYLKLLHPGSAQPGATQSLEDIVARAQGGSGQGGSGGSVPELPSGFQLVQ